MSKIIYIIFISLLMLTLLIRFYFVYQYRKEYKDRDKVDISILLLNDIDINGKNISTSTNLPDSFPPDRVTILLQPQETIHYGQYLNITGRINSKMLSNGRLVKSIYYPKVAIQSLRSDMFFNELLSLRKSIAYVYQMNLSDIDSSLLLGIVFGIKGQIPKTFNQDLQKTGLTHVIAASGMNVTMVAGFLMMLFTRLLRRRFAIVYAIILLLIYTVFSGLQSSIIRATLMGICAFSAQALGKQYFGFYGLVLTSFVMLLYNPGYIFDVGFQLSILATLGILTINPLVSRVSFITEDIATTFSAQLATMPILVSVFGQYSLLSILTNALVLWTIPLLMIVGGLAAAIGIIFPVLGGWIVYLAIPLLWYFEAIVSFFAVIPIQPQLSNITPMLILGYYLILIGIVCGFYVKHKEI